MSNGWTTYQRMELAVGFIIVALHAEAVGEPIRPRGLFVFGPLRRRRQHRLLLIVRDWRRRRPRITHLRRSIARAARRSKLKLKPCSGWKALVCGLDGNAPAGAVLKGKGEASVSRARDQDAAVAILYYSRLAVYIFFLLNSSIYL